MDITKLNLLGVWLAIFIFGILTLIFAVRIKKMESLEYWLGILFMLSIIQSFKKRRN